MPTRSALTFLSKLMPRCPSIWVEGKRTQERAILREEFGLILSVKYGSRRNNYGHHTRKAKQCACSNRKHTLLVLGDFHSSS